MTDTPSADDALLALLRLLDARGYRFVTPTPASHRRVLARPDRQAARSLEDVLGWSLPFAPGAIDGEVAALLDAAGMLGAAGARRIARVRVSSLHDRLYLHSAFPAEDRDAVFFGPDSYRFADLIQAELSARRVPPGSRIVDIGTGSGVGAIVAAHACPDARVVATDINPAALRFARINARAAGVTIETVASDCLDPIHGPIALATANPPYIIDEGGPTYRAGGGTHGGAVSLGMARMAIERLGPGGRLILYTGSAIVRGGDALRAALAAASAAAGCTMRYRELDPDVFGEELESAPYREVDRIALVAAVIGRG